ncbi:hypothetical protein V6Z11_D05G169400 [Gossypium hirsutum]
MNNPFYPLHKQSIPNGFADNNFDQVSPYSFSRFSPSVQMDKMTDLQQIGNY